MSTETVRCDWQNYEGSCQFARLAMPHVYLDDGRVLCPLHTPNDEVKRTPHLAQVKALLESAVQLGIYNFDGVAFPDDLEFVVYGNKGLPKVSFRGCTFGKLVLNLRNLAPHQTVIIERPVMNGLLTVVMPPGAFEAAGQVFRHELVLVPSVSAEARNNFSGACFHAPVRVTNRSYGEWNFSRAEFHDKLTLHFGATGLNIIDPNANISFFRARFHAKGTQRDMQSHYRIVKEVFAETGDRDNEGFFYQLEKRSQRDGLSLGLEKAISAAYDVISGYGRNYVRALGMFGGLQLVAAFLYALASDKFRPVPGFDATIPAFTLAQVFRPFELVALRAPSEIVDTVVGDDSFAWWAVGTFVHGALSLIVLAMFLLALRWRFKRS